MSPMVVWINTRSGMSLGFLGTARCSAVTLGLRSGKGTKAGALGPPPPKNDMILSIIDDFFCGWFWVLMSVQERFMVFHATLSINDCRIALSRPLKRHPMLIAKTSQQ